MGARVEVLQVVSGWQAVELVLRCFFVGIWQLLQMSVKRLWKGHRRKAAESGEVEVTVDGALGRHCYIKIMGVKYHYVESGPTSGQKVLVLCDAPETEDLWGPSWGYVVQQLADSNHHVVTLDLRGTGGSEGGSRADLAPPRAVEELAMLMSGLGVSEHNPAIVIGFGIGGMLAWYLAHSRGALVRSLAAVGAPHPSLYWRHPPKPFCEGALHFIQWPWLPERWLAEVAAAEVAAGGGGGGGRASRARDWTGALHYVRGAAWWSVRSGAQVQAPALLVGGAADAAQLVASAQHARQPALRLVARPGPGDPQLCAALLDYLRPAEQLPAVSAPRAGLVGRVLGAVAGRGRELTARLALPTHA